MSAINCANADSPVFAYGKAWDVILALDYRPILKRRAGVEQCAAKSGADKCRIYVGGYGFRNRREAASLRHDLLGRIFHRILDSAKVMTGHTTLPQPAHLACRAGVRDGDADWKSAGSIGRLRVIDPACGTGTLLMAIAERVRDLVNREGGMDGLEKTLIEEVLHGYDTNLTATHLRRLRWGCYRRARSLPK